MIEYLDISFEDLQKLPVDEINFYITTGLLIAPNRWKITPITEWSYGKVMELLMKFEYEINLADMIEVCSFASGINSNQINKRKWYEVFALYNHLLSEVKTIENILKQLNRDPSNEELAAGIENFNQFGVFATIDHLAGGDPLKYDLIEALPFMVVFTKLKLNKVNSEYQEAYSNVLKYKF